MYSPRASNAYGAQSGSAQYAQSGSNAYFAGFSLQSKNCSFSCN
jgi:hypothetical protein